MILVSVILASDTTSDSSLPLQDHCIASRPLYCIETIVLHCDHCIAPRSLYCIETTVLHRVHCIALRPLYCIETIVLHCDHCIASRPLYCKHFGMKLASWNIQIQSGGLLQKFDAIEHLVSTYGLDIIALSECDYPADMPLPVMDGYDTYRSLEVPTRLIVYVKPRLVVNVCNYTCELPALVVETSQGTYGFLYSPYTNNAYTKDRVLVSDKQRRLKLIDFEIAKSNCFICGDTNVHWEVPNVSKSAIWSWCQDFGFDQIINAPTRHDSSAGQGRRFSPILFNVSVLFQRSYN